MLLRHCFVFGDEAVGSVAFSSVGLWNYRDVNNAIHQNTYLRAAPEVSPPSELKQALPALVLCAFLMPFQPNKR